MRRWRLRMAPLSWMVLSAVSWGQVANGDFAAPGLASWTPGGTGATWVEVEEGTDFSVSGETDTTAIAFPSPPYAAELTTSGTDASEATLTQTVTIASGTLHVAHAEESALAVPRLRVASLTGIAVVDQLLAVSIGAFAGLDFDVSGSCGQSMTVELSMTELPDGYGVYERWFALFDDVVLTGTPCPGFSDGDGDGYCPAGIDSDADGLCVTSGETSVFSPTDCDDTDASRNPLATEIPGDGVDQNCDGSDLCFVDADLDGYGGAATTPGDDDICGNVPGETSSNLDCDDADPTVFPGAADAVGDGVDADCDGRETCWTDGDGDGFGEPTELPSDDADCADAGESTNTDDCDDVDPATWPGATDLPDDGVDQDCDGADAHGPPDPGPGDTDGVGGGEHRDDGGGCGCDGSGAGADRWVGLLVAAAALRRRRLVRCEGRGYGVRAWRGHDLDAAARSERVRR